MRRGNEAIRRCAFPSVRSLEQTISGYVKHNNENPKPFVWTATAQEIIQKVNRCKAQMETLHQEGYSLVPLSFRIP